MALYQRGSIGPEVSKIQTRLRELGLYLGPIDGVFGGGTEVAVTAFQQANALVVDGRVGPQTWAALFAGAEIEKPLIANKPLEFRCMALTGAFETNRPFPDCFAGLSGDFDGQGMSFGVLQWNLGQGSLQPLLQNLVATHPDVVESVFGQNYAEFNAMLLAPKSKQLEWARSVQNLKRSVNEPWRGHFKTLGRQRLVQDIQVQFATRLFNSATSLCKDFGLSSTRAAALMLDIKVQNGSISERIKSQIAVDFDQISPGLSSDEAEVER